MGRYKYATLLYSQPTFAKGFARTLDVGGTFDQYNLSRSPQEADRAAIASDWYAVGADMRNAMNKVMSSKRGLPSDER